MLILRDTDSAVAPARRSVVTIGAYDGVHKGHRAVIAHVQAEAKRLDCQGVVVTFDRHPASVVRPESAPKLLEPITALRSMTRVVADADTAVKVRHGRSFPAWEGSAPWAVVDEAGALLAVYEADGPNAKPSVVLAEAIA